MKSRKNKRALFSSTFTLVLGIMGSAVLVVSAGAVLDLCNFAAFLAADTADRPRRRRFSACRSCQLPRLRRPRMYYAGWLVALRCVPCSCQEAIGATEAAFEKNHS